MGGFSGDQGPATCVVTNAATERGFHAVHVGKGVSQKKLTCRGQPMKGSDLPGRARCLGMRAGEEEAGKWCGGDWNAEVGIVGSGVARGAMAEASIGTRAPSFCSADGGTKEGKGVRARCWEAAGMPLLRWGRWECGMPNSEWRWEPGLGGRRGRRRSQWGEGSRGWADDVGVVGPWGEGRWR